MITAGLLLLLGSASTLAGPCTEEINQLTRQMSARDAGSGPTLGATARGTTGQAQADTSAQHPPTSTMSRETEGRAASPQDVQRQTAGEPTAAQQAQQAKPQPMGQQAAATDALSRARTFDQQGNETECMSAVEQAKRLQQ
jgi:hypothetical protein